MSISVYKIKKWFKMMTGKSLLHVEQGVGKYFVPGKIKGYYNDLTNKVILDPSTLEKEELPKAQNECGEPIVFATTIFQYGLGCYDLFLQTNEPQYINQFKRCVDWAIDNQDNNGGWNISAFAGNGSPYGAMAQGEGISLLVRAFVCFNDYKYYEAANRAKELMLKPLEKGGTCKYSDNNLFLMEFMNKPCVLNGWIFATFGLYDYMIVSDDKSIVDLYKCSLSTIKKYIKHYDNGYWSMYDDGKNIASPFYHKLHISQLKSLMLIDNDAIWEQYYMIFMNYQNKWWNRKKAFVVKMFQKVFSKE